MMIKYIICIKYIYMYLYVKNNTIHKGIDEQICVKNENML